MYKEIKSQPGGGEGERKKKKGQPGHKKEKKGLSNTQRKDGGT